MRRRVRHLPLLLLVLTVLALAACSSGDRSSSDGQSDPGSQSQQAQSDSEGTGATDPSPRGAAGPGRIDLPNANRPASTGEPVPAAEAGEQAPGLDVEAVSRAVVRVETALGQPGSAGFQTIGFGTGSIVDPSGLILTNFHVIDPAIGYDMLLIATTAALDQVPQARFIAEVQIVDQLLDLAVLRLVSEIDGSPLKTDSLNLPILPLGDSRTVQVLDRVLAFGFPDIGDETLTVTTGAISGFLAQEGVPQQRAWFKTDTTISFGNSGGAAVNERGQLVAVPTQGRANELGSIAHLRPIELALPLIAAALRGESNNPGGGPLRRDTSVFDIAFGLDFDQDGTLLEARSTFDSAVTDVFYSFRFQGLSDGVSWVDRWRRDGDLIPELSGPRPPWASGEAGAFLSGINDPGGFGDGVYTLEVVFEGELVASRSFTVGTAVVPELTVGGLRFEGAIRLANGEIELSPILSTNMRSLILFFDYTNATRTSSFEAIWSRDGLQLSRFGPAPWDGGAEGTWLLALDNERGFPPGSYQVDLIFDSETRGSAITTIGLDHDFGDNELIAPGDELSGELGEGEVAAFRVVDLIAGRPLRVAISGAGDADLYVKRGEQVSPDEFGLGWDEAGLRAPFLDGSDESVLIGDVGPGEEWFVALVGFDEGSTFTLTVEQRVGAESSAPPLVEFARQSGVLDQANPNDEYLVDVPAGTSLLTLVMTGTGDVDLYARPSQAVAAGQIGARADGPLLWSPYNLGSSEQINVQDPASGLWFVRVEGFDLPANYTLEVFFDTLVTAPLPRPVTPIDLAAGTLAEDEVEILSFEYAGGGNVLAFAIGGSGDADLYVRFDAEIRLEDLGQAYNGADFQAPFLLGSSETAIFPQPKAGRYSIVVAGAAESNTFDLVVYELIELPETFGIDPLLPGEPESFAIRRGEAPLREIFVPPGAARLEVALSGGGDVDLVLRYLEAPDPSQYLDPANGPDLFTAIAFDSEESIVIEGPLPGVYVLAVVAVLDLQVVDVTVLLE